MKLFPYQQAGVDYLTSRGSAILADSVGLGKTVQALGAIESSQLNPKKVLIFCPAILKLQWASEIVKFYPDATTAIVTGSPAKRKLLWDSSAKYTIANYELLLKDFPLIASRNWDYIIADEITRLKSPNSKTSKLIKKLKARHRIGLTATLISNRPENVWSPFDFVLPNLLGNYYSFLWKYCIKNVWGSVSGYRNLDQLNRIIAPHFLRRTKEEVLPELPDKIYSDIPVQLTAEELKLYDQIKKELLFDIEKSLIDKIDDPTTMSLAPVKTLRLRQATNSLELLGSSIVSSKLNALQTIIESLGGAKCIVFTEFSQMADIIERELLAAKVSVLKITGETTHEQRAAIVERFNRPAADGVYQVLVGTSALTYGMNLGTAGIVIHYDIPWELEKLEQREGRISGLRQTAREDKGMLIYRLIGIKTIDEYIAKQIIKKQTLSDKVLMKDIYEELLV